MYYIYIDPCRHAPVANRNLRIHIASQQFHKFLPKNVFTTPIRFNFGVAFVATTMVWLSLIAKKLNI